MNVKIKLRDSLYPYYTPLLAKLARSYLKAKLSITTIPPHKRKEKTCGGGCSYKPDNIRAKIARCFEKRNDILCTTGGEHHELARENSAYI